MKYYTYLNKNEILSLLAQLPWFNFDIDAFNYINTVSTRCSNDINICPELYCGKDKENRKRIDIRASEFQSRDFLETYIITNIQDISDMRNMRFYYDSVDRLVEYAKNDNVIYYDNGRLARPVSRKIKKKKKIFSRSIEDEEIVEELENANYMLLNGAKILTEEIMPQQIAMYSAKSKSTNVENQSTINEMFDSNVNILGHFIKNDEEGKIIKPIATYIEY